MDCAALGSLVQRHGRIAHRRVRSGIPILNEHACLFYSSAGCTAISSITITTTLVLAYTLSG